MDSVQLTSLAHRAKRVIVWTMVVSFGAAAAGGIIVLLGDIWSDTASQVLVTTAVTGLFSVAVFCGATLLARPGSWFGILTVIVSISSLALVIYFIWVDAYNAYSIGWEWVLSACLLTGCAAAASLILLLVGHPSWTVKIALAFTLGLMALSALLSLIMIWNVDAVDLDWFPRLTGIMWILTALGVVVVPVAALLLRRPPRAPVATDISSRSAERIRAAADDAGITADELIDRLLGPQQPR